MPKAPTKLPLRPAKKNSPRVKREFGVGLANPQDLTNKQVQSLAGSVGAHMPRKSKAENRYGKKTP